MRLDTLLLLLSALFEVLSHNLISAAVFKGMDEYVSQKVCNMTRFSSELLTGKLVNVEVPQYFNAAKS